MKRLEWMADDDDDDDDGGWSEQSRATSTCN